MKLAGAGLASGVGSGLCSVAWHCCVGPQEASPGWQDKVVLGWALGRATLGGVLPVYEHAQGKMGHPISH